jgi:hypothetical protein
MTTTKQLAERLLEARGKATQGTWEWFKEDYYDGMPLTSRKWDKGYLKYDNAHSSEQAGKDADNTMEFVALAANHIAELCARLIELEDNGLKVYGRKIEVLNKTIAKLEKQLEVCKANYKQLADACEWYTDKGTEQERHHFLKVEALGNYETDMQELEKVEG